MYSGEKVGHPHIPCDHRPSTCQTHQELLVESRLEGREIQAGRLHLLLEGIVVPLHPVRSSTSVALLSEPGFLSNSQTPKGSFVRRKLFKKFVLGHTAAVTCRSNSFLLSLPVLIPVPPFPLLTTSFPSHGSATDASVTAACPCPRGHLPLVSGGGLWLGQNVIIVSPWGKQGLRVAPAGGRGSGRGSAQPEKGTPAAGMDIMDAT